MTKDYEKQSDALPTLTAQSCRGKSWIDGFLAEPKHCSDMAGTLIHQDRFPLRTVSHVAKELQGRTCLIPHGVMA
jgi:hypothetical protein